MKKLILALIITITSLGRVYAESAGGIFVEPMLTYERGDGEINFPAPVNNVDTTLRGFGVGGRLGLHTWESIFLGIDGRYSMPKWKDTGLHQDTNSKAWNLGPVIGFQMPTPIGLRIWGSWIAAGQLDPDLDKGVNEEFKSGNGFRIGAGIKLGMTSLNAEYQDIKYNEVTLEEVGVFTPGYTTNSIELHNRSLILSLSFPIAI